MGVWVGYLGVWCVGVSLIDPKPPLQPQPALTTLAQVWMVAWVYMWVDCSIVGMGGCLGLYVDGL